MIIVCFKLRQLFLGLKQFTNFLFLRWFYNWFMYIWQKYVNFYVVHYAGILNGVNYKFIIIALNNTLLKIKLVIGHIVNQLVWIMGISQIWKACRILWDILFLHWSSNEIVYLIEKIFERVNFSTLIKNRLMYYWLFHM